MVARGWGEEGLGSESQGHRAQFLSGVMKESEIDSSCYGLKMIWLLHLGRCLYPKVAVHGLKSKETRQSYCRGGGSSGRS